MKFSIIHEIPGRLRINLSLPGGKAFSKPFVEDELNNLGAEKVSFNSNTNNLFVVYDGSHEMRAKILSAIEGMPIAIVKRKASYDKVDERLGQKKKAVIRGGGLLLISPLMPLPIKPFVAVFGAMPIFKKGIKAILNQRLNIDVLDSSAIVAAMGIGDYKTAGIISFLLKVGDYLEEWTKDRSRKALHRMFDIADEQVWLKIDGAEKMVNAADIKEGDVVIVRTGNRIPVDGVVEEGEAMVNQASMTGEPLPVMKKQGVMVYAGTAVAEGSLYIKAVKVGEERRISKIVQVIEESEHLKADVQSHAESLADRVVPYTFLLSGLTYAFTGNLLRAASVLLVDYSCAIKLSTPMAIMAGMIRAAKDGVLIKGGKFIEKLSKSDAFILDKTGTLTKAEPAIVDVIPFNGYNRNYILRHTACVEEHFPHPIATAVVKKAKDEGLIHEEMHGHVEYVAAHGIVSIVNGKRMLVGSRHFICEDEGIDIKIAGHMLKDLADKGYSALYVAIEDSLAGIIVIEDPLREDSYSFLRMLKGDLKIKRIIMLTGDNEASARNAALQLGIPEYFGEVFPEGKLDILKILKEEGHVVAMVGDGINDSAALAHADVGISMKHGADIAKEACDVLLLDGSLMSILKAKKISEKAMNTIRQNFKYIIGINSSLILLGLGGLSTPAFSAFMHNASTVLSALNSLRLASHKVRSGKDFRCKTHQEVQI